MRASSATNDPTTSNVLHLAVQTNAYIHSICECMQHDVDTDDDTVDTHRIAKLTYSHHVAYYSQSHCYLN